MSGQNVWRVVSQRHSSEGFKLTRLIILLGSVTPSDNFAVGSKHTVEMRNRACHSCLATSVRLRASGPSGRALSLEASLAALAVVHSLGREPNVAL
jgi:hypothetical protein